MNAKFHVYDGNVSVIASSQTGTDSGGNYVYVQWTAAANTTYYICFVGDTSVTFTVT